MRTIPPAELHHRLAQQPDLPVLDVRTPAEFAEVHAPRARNLPLDALKPGELAGQYPPHEPVYLLCRSGQRAAKAAEKLADAGFAEPIVVEGGTLAWIEANLPVVRGRATAISLERQVRIVAGALVFTGTALGWFVHRGFFVLPAFVGAGLVFAGVTDFCGMGLLLAKMPWNKRGNS
jgi:rhodanese-related sulfurtransferase